MPNREHRPQSDRSCSPRREHARSFHHHSLRSRSRSPQRDRSARRSRSHKREHGERLHRHHHCLKKEENPAPKDLPFNARQLTKHDFIAFKPMFALYLDIQKQKDLWPMDDKEARGRWKSFIGKWNRGVLAEGWYEPGTFERAVAAAKEDGLDEVSNPGRKDEKEGVEDEDEVGRLQRRGRGKPGWKSEARGEISLEEEPQRTQGRGDSDSDDYGPALPGRDSEVSPYKRSGPTIPSMEDLKLKKENESEESYARRKAAREDQKWERKAERKAQNEQLDELVPRAAAGTRERRIEKKRQVNEKMKSFRDNGDGQVEVPDEELMGGGEGVRELKQKMSNDERKKTERELRREEISRARNAEREERLSDYREKEDKTMEMLRNLARQNFGPRAG